MCTPESGKCVHLEPGVCVHLEGGEIWRKRGTYYDDKHNSSATPVFAHHHPRFPLKNQASGALLLWRGVFCIFLLFIYLEKNLGKRGVGEQKPRASDSEMPEGEVCCGRDQHRCRKEWEAAVKNRDHCCRVGRGWGWVATVKITIAAG